MQMLCNSNPMFSKNVTNIQEKGEEQLRYSTLLLK